MNYILVFLYSQIKEQQNLITMYVKQNDAIPYVIYVTFCITTYF